MRICHRWWLTAIGSLEDCHNGGANSVGSSTWPPTEGLSHINDWRSVVAAKKWKSSLKSHRAAPRPIISRAEKISLQNPAGRVLRQWETLSDDMLVIASSVCSAQWDL
jgi:hypothetical protein